MLDQIAEKIKFDDDDRLNAFDYEYESLNLYCCYLTSQKASYFDDFFFNRIYLFFEAAARHNHVKCWISLTQCGHYIYFLSSRKSHFNKWYNRYSDESLLQVASKHGSVECVKYICDQLISENSDRDSWRITILGPYNHPTSKKKYKKCLKYISSVSPNEKKDAEERRLQKIKQKEDLARQRAEHQRPREQKPRHSDRGGQVVGEHVGGGLRPYDNFDDDFD